MKEAFLHYVWNFRKCDIPGLKLVSGQSISILFPGQHNQLAGPDFLNAQLRIEDTVWAGHVEIHVNASDWYAHRHEQDPAYRNVILHVVWHDDAVVVAQNGIPLPTLELCNFLPQELYASYNDLLTKRVSFIPCEKEVGEVDSIIVRSWLERLYLERLQRKVAVILEEVEFSAADWEAIFFVQLARGFGTKINKEGFEAMARQIPMRVIARSRSNRQSLEALFMGVGGLLDEARSIDPYMLDLRREFEYLKQKFDLQPMLRERLHFFKLRPLNFPTIRLSQLAELLHRPSLLSSLCIEKKSLGELHQLMRVGTSSYWETHYTFGKNSKSKIKLTSTAFINSLLINVILPFKYAYLRWSGGDPWAEVMEVIEQIPPEKNSIIRRFEKMDITVSSALDTQALLELYGRYCTSKRCLECAIGHRLLGRM